MSKKEKNINEKAEQYFIDMATNEACKLFKEGKIKNGKDVEGFLDKLLQPILQKMLEVELDNHLEHTKYEHSEHHSNYRNGHCTPKKVKTKYGEIEIATPRDRNSTFTPVIVEKKQTTFTGFEDKCISLYAKGMSLRDIEKTLKEIYGVNINKDQISRFINGISEEVEKWKNRPLDPCYIFTYSDCLYTYIKEDLKSDKRAIYVVIGVNVYGKKEVLGFWIGNQESASFWTGIMDDLKNRGVKDILYMTSDGIAGFKNSLEFAFPKTQAQRCVVHLVRNIYGLCPKKEAKGVVKDYKKIYQSSSLDEAEVALEDFVSKYKKLDKVVKKAEEFMQYLEPLFELPIEIRKAIYTSNAVESVNSAIRKVTRGKGSFPSKESVEKVIFLRLKELAEKWTKPIKNFPVIREQLIELFGERYTQYLET